MLVMKQMKTLLRSATFGLAVAATATMTLPLAAQAQSFDDAERAEIGQIVRDYLLANPEVLIEVQEALETRQIAEQAEQRRSIIETASDDLFRNVNDPVLGNPAGDVTVVEFFDYNCGFCRRAMDDMNQIIASDPNVRFVLKEFPILGEDSQDAHMVALAFNRLMPEKYAEFHDQLMNFSGRASEESAISIATELGADETQLRDEMQNPANVTSIESTYMIAQALGITGTPSYVIGDQLVPGALGVDELRARVEEARACTETSC